MKECVALVPAAGMGSRMGARKAYLDFKGRPLLGLTLQALSAVPEITRVFVALHPEDMSLWEGRPLWPHGDPRPCKAVLGGETRAHSVREAFFSAFKEVGGDFLAVIHDAARPFANGKLISNVISHAYEGVAASCALDVVDTIKEIQQGGQVRTLDRSRLKAIQTPQVIHSRDLLLAWERWNSAGCPPVTDDLQLIEGMGVKVTLLPGDPMNVKVTHPHDLHRKNTLEIS